MKVEAGACEVWVTPPIHKLHAANVTIENNQDEPWRHSWRLTVIGPQEMAALRKKPMTGLPVFMSMVDVGERTEVGLWPAPDRSVLIDFSYSLPEVRV